MSFSAFAILNFRALCHTIATPPSPNQLGCDCCTRGRWLPGFRRSKLPPSSGYKEAECSSEIFVPTYQTTRCHNRNILFTRFYWSYIVRWHKGFVRRTDRLYLSIVGLINAHCSMAALNKTVLIEGFTFIFWYHRIHQQMNFASDDMIL